MNIINGLNGNNEFAFGEPRKRDKVKDATNILAEAACRVAGEYGAAAAVPFGKVFCDIAAAAHRTHPGIASIAMNAWMEINAE